MTGTNIEKTPIWNLILGNLHNSTYQKNNQRILEHEHT